MFSTIKISFHRNKGHSRDECKIKTDGDSIFGIGLNSCCEWAFAGIRPNSNYFCIDNTTFFGSVYTEFVWLPLMANITTSNESVTENGCCTYMCIKDARKRFFMLQNLDFFLIIYLFLLQTEFIYLQTSPSMIALIRCYGNKLLSLVSVPGRQNFSSMLTE